MSFFVFDTFVLFVHIVAMKRKRARGRKSEAKAVDSKREDKAVVQSGETASVVPMVPGGHPDELPPPDILLDLAQAEPDALLLADYIEVIRTLRQDKRFSFREIATWLNEQGVPTDHNAVYREYTEWMHDPQGYERTRDLEAEEIEHEQGRA
jgi:hypothetical protein